MSLLSLQSVGVTTNVALFSELDLTLSAGDRLGLVAANGRGKSSLLKCIARLAEPTSGSITLARGATIALVPQAVPEALAGLSLREAVLTGLPEAVRDYEDWRVGVVLDEMGAPHELHDVMVSALSGGWQRMMLLARAWVGEPDVLLLDEPTNHLDLERILGLEAWLSGPARQAAAIVASHDRAFLDAVTTRTLFLRNTRSVQFALPYSAARAALAETDATAERVYEKSMKEAAQLRRQAAKLNNIGINSGSDLLVVKTKQLRARAERIEEGARPAHKDQSAGAVRLANSGTHAKVLVTLDRAQVTTPDGRVLFQTGERRIFLGDRVVLLGENGRGKTRLLTLIAEAIANPERHGSVKVTPSVVPGYADQHLSQIDPAGTPMRMVTGAADVGDQRARALLAEAGVGIDMQDRPSGGLSLGQRSRVMLLLLRLRAPNFYLLDEPTNHLDIERQEALETELLAQGASCVLVSHDRRFVSTVGSRFWEITPKGIVETDSPEPFFARLAGRAS